MNATIVSLIKLQTFSSNAPLASDGFLNSEMFSVYLLPKRTDGEKILLSDKDRFYARRLVVRGLENQVSDD